MSWMVASGQGHLSDSPVPGHCGRSRTVNPNPCSDRATSKTYVGRRTGSGEHPVFSFYFSQVFLNVCRLFIDNSLLQIWHAEFWFIRWLKVVCLYEQLCICLSCILICYQNLFFLDLCYKFFSKEYTLSASNTLIQFPFIYTLFYWNESVAFALNLLIFFLTVWMKGIYAYIIVN